MMARGAILQVCWRCNGTGEYKWGGSVNGKPVHVGPCFKCIGGGDFPVTNGAAWYTAHGTRILASIERMALAAGKAVNA